MRLLFVSPYFYPAWSYGGAMRSCYELARALAARGHTVRVLTTDGNGGARIPMERGDITVPVSVEGVEVYYFRNRSNNLAFRHRLFWPPEYFRSVERHVRDCEVLHLHELRSSLAPSAYRAARRAKVPYVVSPHGGLPRLGKAPAKRVFDALYGSAILKHAAMLMAVSPLEQAQAREFGVEAARAGLVPNTVSPADYRALPDRGVFRTRWSIRAETVLLFLGRLHWVKGADILLRAFGALAKTQANVHLAIAGPDDGQEPELRRMVDSAGLGERVTFTGFLEHGQKLEALAGCDALVIPSRSEVFAIAALEALCCGLPMVLSSACGLAPMPGEDCGVRQFQTENPEDLMRVLAVFLESPRRPKLETSRAFMAREFSPNAVAEKAESVYAEALRRYHREAQS